MKFNFLFKTFFIAITLVLVASCDKDFNELGSDLVNDDHYNFDIDSTKSISAYNQKVGPVETSNLPVNALGYNNSPIFGKTKASFVTQVELNTLNPTFKTHVSIDSVYLYIPYFCTFLNKDSATGDSTYELDSIQGSGKIDLKIYENGYFLRDFDPSSSLGLTERQKYYSSQTSQFVAAIGNGGAILNNANSPGENTDFTFSPSELKYTYIKNSETVIKERKTPGMSIVLDKTFFMNKIINAPAGKLINNNVFKEYFRGLYFKVDEYQGSSSQGIMSLLDFSQGKIIISFHQDKVNSVDPVTEDKRERKTFQLNLAGNSVNLFEQETNAAYNSAITAPQVAGGHDRLYLKGQEGATTVISLFAPEIDNHGYDENGTYVAGANGVADELDDLRNPPDGKKWLINEASLSFYIDRNAMINSNEPNRITLYDYTNKRPILDYYSDNTTSAVSSKYNKLVFGGIIEKEKLPDGTFGKGIKYKIRITNYLKSLLKNNDSTNVKLGLVVTENIGFNGTTVRNQRIKTPLSTFYDRVPTESVVNPRGTVIYGTSSNVPENKRLKLDIYYTKPD